ncbi:MAG: DJ-1/PfpI family protein [Candidatus Methylomirabilis sp.]|nr:DJ-1/PfpI family protein [Deltaproteobacteria bacterium]
MKRVLVPLETGFEEIEAVTVIDVLRRAGIEVIVASESGGLVTGSHEIAVKSDARLAEVDADALDAVVLPGGNPGYLNLARNAAVTRIVRRLDERKATVGAVCAAPYVLNQEKVLAGRRATIYPALKDALTDAIAVDDPVVVDGHVVTSQGPGTTMAFALELVRLLAGKEARDEHAGRLLFER